MTLEFLAILIASCLAVNLFPGPSILLVSSISAARGFRAAVLATLGMTVGAFIHVLLAASGIAAILATSELTFSVIQYLGAIYLIYLGIDLLRPNTASGPGKPDTAEIYPWQYFRRGLLVDLFNPKIALFFLAFLPQFLSWLEAPGFLFSVTLGSVFLFTGIIVNCSIAYLICAGIRRRPGQLRKFIERWIPGSVLILLGFSLIWEKP